MYSLDEKMLVYFEDEEHLIRRLGSALVTCWPSVPEPLQEALLVRAQQIVDDEPSECIGTDLQAFLRAHH